MLKVELNKIQNRNFVSFSKNKIKRSSNRDEFISSAKAKNNTPTRETLFQRLKNKISPQTINQKINEILLESLFDGAEGKYRPKKIETSELRDLIKELSKLDFKNIEEKYTYLTEEVSIGRNIVPSFIKNILKSENITVETLKVLYGLSQTKNALHSGSGYVYLLETMVYFLNNYKNFDTMPTKAQYDFINKIEHYFDAEDINNLDEDNDLERFDLIKDIKKAGSITAFKEKLINMTKNSPVNFIPVEEKNIEDFMNDNDFSFESLKNALSATDLNKYRIGFPLKYSRDDFIKDFKKVVQKLDNDETKQVFKYFKFFIDEADDIIKFPSPNTSSISEYSSKVQNAILALRKLVNDFTFNNEIQLDREDKELENILNKFIKVFPEFISVIGKTQHRGDTIDFHTLEDLKLCFNDPMTKDLSKEEIRILFLATMFHDIAKKQDVVDIGHQRPSAYYAKEIIKKLPLTPKEKERIYNLILNSHWTTDGTTIYDIALNFRFNNDFKMAQILAKADGASAGFSFPLTEKQLQNIQNRINEINSTGIPLFADNLPVDKSKFPISDEGIRYLDFTDENKDLSEYGFKKGTTVKDLNFLCHNTAGSLKEITDLCDDSKDICLSTELKNASNKGIVTTYNAAYNGNCHVILHCNNENIGLGGINVSCTGGKKGLKEFKNYVFINYFDDPANDFQKKLLLERRSEISNALKMMMGLDDSEYAEFFNQINKFKAKEDIEDITLSTGKILKKEEIKKNILEIQNRLIKNKSMEHYINEVVIFRPKIEGIVMGKYGFFKTPIEQSEIKKIAKENNIPVILV